MDSSINRKLKICLISIVGWVMSEQITPVRETQPVTLSCAVHEPAVVGTQVKWYKGSELVSIDRMVIKYRTSLQILQSPPPNEWNLKILRMTSEFEDEYTCKVKEIPQGVFKVVVEAAPKIVDAESSGLSVIRPEYTDISLHCKVVGYPQASIFWSRKSRGQGGSIKELGVQTETLTIVNATRYADDIYSCMAENKYGSVQREISLRIVFPPEVTLFKQEAEAAKGHSVMMACIVQSSPLHDAFWANEKGERLNTNFKYIVSDERDPVYPVRYMTVTLRKDNWEDDDYGQYSCNVSNGTVISAKHFTLIRPVDTDDETVIKYDVR